MNLPSLQYIDIHNSITSSIILENYPSCSTRLRNDGGFEGTRYIAVETDHPCSRHVQNEPQTLLKARPLFLNSLLSTEIEVSFSHLSNTHKKELTKNHKETPPRGVLDYPKETELHYRLLEPLPSYLGGFLYRAGNHVVVILDDENTLEMYDTSLVHDLQLQLNRNLYRGHSPHEVLVPHFLGKNGTQNGSLKSRRKDKLLMELYRLSHSCHRINVIGKSGLVLSDSSGIVIDAIRSAVPAAFVTPPPAGFEKIQDCITRFFQHGDKLLLLTEQQHALDTFVEEQSKKYHVMSNLNTLQSVIHKNIPNTTSAQQVFDTRGHASQHDSSLQPTTTLLDNLILHSQQSLCAKENKAVRLKPSLESSRRKFQKFKESPSRFMEDSQSVILRSLAPNRTQQ